MIGLVLVTHGNLAVEFKAAMEHVVGPQTCVQTICIAAEDDMELRRADIAAAVKACNSEGENRGVIILTDMFGGTPSNLAISLLGPQVEVIAGVNLPMLIKLASVRKSCTVEAAVQAAQDAGRKYIAVASRMLGEAA
jgi:PTS system mannose-specific IIA component